MSPGTSQLQFFFFPVLILEFEGAALKNQIREVLKSWEKRVNITLSQETSSCRDQCTIFRPCTGDNIVSKHKQISQAFCMHWNRREEQTETSSAWLQCTERSQETLWKISRNTCYQHTPSITNIYYYWSTEQLTTDVLQKSAQKKRWKRGGGGRRLKNSCTHKL